MSCHLVSVGISKLNYTISLDMHMHVCLHVYVHTVCTCPEDQHGIMYILYTVQGMIASAHAVQIKLESERILEKAFAENKVHACKLFTYMINQTSRRLNKAKQIESTRLRKSFFKRKIGCLRWDLNPRHSALQTKCFANLASEGSVDMGRISYTNTKQGKTT